MFDIRLHMAVENFTAQILPLAGIGQAPTEAKLLLRRIYATLAKADGITIGAEK